MVAGGGRDILQPPREPWREVSGSPLRLLKQRSLGAYSIQIRVVVTILGQYALTSVPFSVSLTKLGA